MAKKAPTARELQQQAEKLLAQAEALDEAPPLTREDVSAMTPDEINAARDAGRLDHLL